MGKKRKGKLRRGVQVEEFESIVMMPREWLKYLHSLRRFREDVE